MKISSCGDNIKYIIEDKELLYFIGGNIKTEYISAYKSYRISRVDGKMFDGTEYIEKGRNKEKVYGIEKIVEHEINLFTLLQNNVESLMFDKFYYYYSESKKSIIVEPIFSKELGIDMYLPIDRNEVRLCKHKKGIKK